MTTKPSTHHNAPGPAPKPTEAARSAILGALQADLVGPFYPADYPGSTEEVLPLAPSRWYLTGFLAPDRDRETRDPLADDEFNGLEDEAEETAAPELAPLHRSGHRLQFWRGTSGQPSPMIPTSARRSANSGRLAHPGRFRRCGSLAAAPENR